MTKRMLLLVPMLVFVFTALVSAQWSSDPALNNAIVRTSNNQTGQQIISDGKGGAIICWHDERIQTSSFDVYAQRIDKDGYIRWTVNGVAIAVDFGSQSKPDIVADGAGGAFITWTDTRAGDNDVYAQRIDSSGNVLWTKDGVVVADGAMNQSDPKITSDGRGGVIITYINQASSGPGTHVYAMRLGGDGTKLWAAPSAVCTSFILQNKAVIASDGRSGAYIAWAHYRQSGYDIYAQRIDSNGVAYWTKNGLAVVKASGSQDAPVLVSDGTGNAFLGFSDYGGGSVPNLYIAMLKDAGPANNFRITSTTGGQTGHGMSLHAPGVLCVAWEDGRTSGKKRTFAQVVDTAGTKLWAANGVEVSNRAGDQLTPSVVTDGAGGAIVIWEDKTKGALQTDVYGQRISDAGALMWGPAGVPVCTANNPQQFPRLISDGHNGAIAAWEDFRPNMSNVEIYASRILADGSFPIGPPQLSLSTKTVAFGDVGLGMSSTRDVTLSNPGGVALTISATTASDPQFSLTPESNTIAPGASINATVRFQPTTKNAVTGRIVVTSNSIFGPDTIVVTGRGTAEAAIQTDKNALAFGNVQLGSGKALALVVTNPGNDTLTISAISSSSPRFVPTITSRVLPPGASFTDSVRFTPTALGPVSGELTLTSNAAGSPTTVSLSGFGVGTVSMTMDHGTISFGEVLVGSSKDTTVSIGNTGTDTLRIASITSGNAGFSVLTQTATIAPAANKAFTVRFAPLASGPLNTVLIVTSNAPSSPDTIVVDGIGTLPAGISFVPSRLAFDTVGVGKSKELPLSIGNSGSTPLLVTSITSTLADFVALEQQVEIPGGGSSSVTIRFTPAEKGDRSGALIIESNAATSPDTVLVDGRGTEVNPVDALHAMPGEFQLGQNYPNPFLASTTIGFSIPLQGEVRLVVLDCLGREIAVLAEGVYRAGGYNARFDAAALPSGLYLYRLSHNGNTLTRRMLIAR